MEKSTPIYWGGEQKVFHDGNFYQPSEETECVRRRDLVLGAIALNKTSELSLSDYQRWVELDWKEEHHTVEAFERFEKGLIGEIVELDDEIDPVRRENALINWKSRPRLEKASEESISELGDVLWYGAAILSNAKLGLERCFREYLHDKWEPVEWGENFTIGDVEARIAGHTPYPFSRRSVGDLFLKGVDEERSIARDIHYSGYTMAALMSRVFNRERITTDPEGFLREIGVEKAGGLFVAYVAYHADKTLGSSLEEIVAKNVKKISLRAERNHIDKADGQRSLEEA